MNPLRILLAEDNAVNQKVVAKMLERIGYSLEIVDDGSKAVVAAREKNYDIILMDIMMPHMDGLEATRRIRSQETPDEHRVHIIALTANAMNSDRSTCIAAGMDDFISKPFSMETLRDGIETGARAQSSDTAEPIDMGQFRIFTELIADNDSSFILELMNDFLVDLERLRVDLHAALESNSSSSVHMIAHTLRSSSAVFGASAIVDMCTEFEKQAQEGNLADIRLRLSEFDGTLKSVHNRISELVQTVAC